MAITDKQLQSYLKYLGIIKAIEDDKNYKGVDLNGLELIGYVAIKNRDSCEKIMLITSIPIGLNYSKHVVIYIKNDENAKNLMNTLINDHYNKVLFFGKGHFIENRDDIAFNSEEKWRFEIAISENQKSLDDFGIFKSMKR
ncbi:MAG: hypothetical protein ACP5RT_00980 [Candidatus Micrarchaeia archaeon]